MELDATTVKTWLNEVAQETLYYQSAPERKEVTVDLQHMAYAFGQMMLEKLEETVVDPPSASLLTYAAATGLISAAADALAKMEPVNTRLLVRAPH